MDFDNLEKLLTLSPENAKGLFRRGLGHLRLRNLDKALADLKKACMLEPKDAGFRKHYDECLEEMKKADIQTKLVYKKALGGE